MAKILLKNYDELLVSDDAAHTIAKDKELILDQIEISKPYIIHHNDGMWIGTLKDIATVSKNEKSLPKFFLTDDNQQRFHVTHGYGKYQGKYESSYGYLDVETQYLIGANVARLGVDTYGRKQLLVVRSPEYEKYSDYWKDYLNRLDEFNELKQPWKTPQ